LAVGVVAGATAWLVIRAGSSGPAVAVDDRPQTHVATPQAAELPADEDVDTLPATVPIALALGLTELGDRWGKSDAGDAGDREHKRKTGRGEADFSP